MFKFLKNTGILFLVVCIIVLFTKDTIIRLSAQKIGSSALGAQLTIGHFSWNLLAGQVLVRDLKIGHPPGYEKGVFADISRIELRYDTIALMTGSLHMPLVRIDLKEMTVIKNSEGKLSVDEFKILHAAESEVKAGKTKNETKPAPKFLIDELKLNIGQVVFKDYFKKDTPKILVYDLNLKDRVSKNIDSVPKLVAAVIMQAVKKTAIQGAGIYAATAVMGASFLPGAVLGVIVADDDAAKDFNKGYGAIFDHCEKFLKDHGQIKTSDRKKGMIDGKIDGVDVKFEIQEISWIKTRVKVTARKFMLPKPEFAGGILYQIGEKH